MLSWLIPGLWEGIQWSWHLDSDKQTDHSLEKNQKNVMSKLEERAYATKWKKDYVKRVEAHKQILSELVAIKESLGRQSIRLRRARSETERDLALEQTAHLVNEIVLGFLHPASLSLRASQRLSNV